MNGFFTDIVALPRAYAERLARPDALALSALALSAIGLGLFVAPPFVALALAFAPIGALALLFFVRYPRYWLYTGAILNYFWIAQGKVDYEITLKEYALVAFYIGGLWIWLLGMVVVQRRRIARHIGDTTLLVAVAASSANIILALVNADATPLSWLREWLLFFMPLYYFPLREHLTERKHIATFFALTAGVFVFIGASNLWQYVKAASNVLYAYQIWTSRKMMNTHIFMCAVILCSMGALYASRLRARLGMLFLTLFYAVVVVVSFSRGFWISGMVGIVGTLWLLDKRKLLTFGAYALAGAFVFTLAVQIIFPDKATFVLKVIQSRFASSAAGVQDLSLLSRLYETKAVVATALEHPIGGIGLGAFFVFYEPIDQYYMRASFVHNGYLFVWLKLGIPFFVAFYGAWAYMMRRAYRLASLRGAPAIARILSAGAFGGLLGLTLLNITSAIPEGRDGFYCLSILFASIGFAERLAEENHR